MLVNRIDGVSINGTQLLLNRIYDSVGFNRIKDDVLRHLVVARISQPSSKLATTSYLRSYFKEDIDLSRIYRFEALKADTDQFRDGSEQNDDLTMLAFRITKS